jgi:hypothetical protein
MDRDAAMVTFDIFQYGQAEEAISRIHFLSEFSQKMCLVSISSP